MEDGRRVQVSLGTDDFGIAVQKALEISHAPFLDAAEPLEGEIRDFIGHKVRQNEYSRDSAATKHYVLEHLARFLSQRDPALIATADIERFYRAQQARVSESTAQGYMTTLRSFFNWLVSTRKIRSNPVTQVKLARLDQKGRVEFCTPEIRDKLIAECRKEDLLFVLYCGFHAGLRKQEIIEARPSWFNLEAGTQPQFAALVGTSAITIKRIENGTLTLSDKLAARIWAATGAMQIELLQGAKGKALSADGSPYTSETFRRWDRGLESRNPGDGAEPRPKNSPSLLNSCVARRRVRGRAFAASTQRWLRQWTRCVENTVSMPR